MNGSSNLIDMRHTIYSSVWHHPFIRVTWLIHMCDMTLSYVRHDSLIYVTWLRRMYDMSHLYLWHDSFISVPWHFTCVTWLLYMCDMTHSYVWHDRCLHKYAMTLDMCDMTPFIRVTWLLHTWDMSPSYVCHISCTCVTWRLNTCDVTYEYIWYYAFICVIMHMCDMTHNVHCDFLGELHISNKCFPTCFIHTCDLTQAHVWYDSQCGWWFGVWAVSCTYIHTYTYICNVSYTDINVIYRDIKHDTELYHVQYHFCIMFRSRVWSNSCTCVTGFIA